MKYHIEAYEASEFQNVFFLWNKKEKKITQKKASAWATYTWKYKGENNKNHWKSNQSRSVKSNHHII